MKQPTSILYSILNRRNPSINLTPGLCLTRGTGEIPTVDPPGTHSPRPPSPLKRITLLGGIHKKKCQDKPEKTPKKILRRAKRFAPVFSFVILKKCNSLKRGGVLGHPPTHPLFFSPDAPPLPTLCQPLKHRPAHHTLTPLSQAWCLTGGVEHFQQAPRPFVEYGENMPAMNDHFCVPWQLKTSLSHQQRPAEPMFFSAILVRLNKRSTSKKKQRCSRYSSNKANR